MRVQKQSLETAVLKEYVVCMLLIGFGRILCQNTVVLYCLVFWP